MLDRKMGRATVLGLDETERGNARKETLVVRYANYRRAILAGLFTLFFAVFSPGEEAATKTDSEVGPANILIIANDAYPHSVEIANYYAQRRGISTERILSLTLASTEDIDRDCFDMKIAAPVRAYLEGHAEIRCIVTVYGVPLNIWDPQPIQANISILKQQLEGIKSGTFQDGAGIIEEQIGTLEEEVKASAKRAASVDSELALIGREHVLEGYVESPFLTTLGRPQGCYWVARLDATSPEDVKAMIDGALEAEAGGLKGIAYFDARNLAGSDDYSRADESIRRAAQFARKFALPTVLDDKPELFGVGACPEACVYWGWYSLAKYVDSFKFVPGAVAVHIASGECNSLREGTYWCRNLIANGAAVTMGPTNEPYLEAFPEADAFLGRLFEGECVGAAYFGTERWLSWRMVLLGDPLYRPFAAREEVKTKGTGNNP